jgi:hypothetical protein
MIGIDHKCPGPKAKWRSTIRRHRHKDKRMKGRIKKNEAQD